MVAIKVRKIQTNVEEVFHEGGPVAAKPLRQGSVVAVIENPYAGRYVPDILPMMEALKPLGLEMSQRLVKALGVSPAEIEGFGKGAIVGAAGELEHGALWHVPGGYAMRELLGDAKAIVPSTKKVGGPGTRIDIPVTHINASYVRSHFSALEVGVSDGPKADEIAVILVMTTGPRIHERVGGLKVSEVKGEDGLR
ncbi:MAG TPA: amino acid synthesis family protein [Dongiaceae bacterium]